MSVIAIIVTAIIFFLSGIFIGVMLGKEGSLEFLAFLGTIPGIILKKPEEMKRVFAIWKETSEERKLGSLKRKKELKEFKSAIQKHKTEIKGLKSRQNKVKWGL
jgi:hypothetical protein